MLRGLGLVRVACALVLMSPAAALAQNDLIVEKKTFAMPSYTTVAGATIKDVKIGWEAAGTLNADKSNAILITHFFTGTSHAFGKYKADDKAAGYWDYLIGPGKTIDTNKYYVLSSDTLVNLNVNAPNVVTTGPASINPDTGKPYGMSFPVVSIKDFVRVQKALTDSLGIKKLHAVVGASMGALQTYEWAASFPQAVDRIVPVIGTPRADAFLIEWLNVWAAPIKLDPNWNGGNYYGGKPPVEGLKLALKMVTLQANHTDWAIKTFGDAPAEAGKDPAAAMGNEFKIEAAIDAAAAARAQLSDANSLIYLVKANQLASADPAKIKAPTLVLYSPTDLVFYRPLVEDAARAIAAGGTSVDTAPLPGPNGHLNGVFAVAQQAEKIKAFLDK
ncbi:homoserine acetyltransferase [Pseudolabrys sp. Root1462]|uniref:E22 family MetX-like putative esterase n=1 Tax=Pseudolabrys sp. Root1462 TaxID=1736466 RepID=UPI000702B4D5|nr:homoserine O-acetyltransferase [Pseudolabrys sp. Root1462]KQZ01142.1 homoserine acetyltransferase [Pseudolabrys sp. Root1462]